MTERNETKITLTETPKDPHDIKESVDELRAKLEAMKQLLDENQKKNTKTYPSESNQYRYHPPARHESLIDGNFLSTVFAVVFLLIISVSFYAFQNLYFAILKKFPSKHTEL